MKTYNYLLNQILDKDMWPSTCLNELLPPEVENMPGRPKVLKRKEPIEIEQNLQQGSLKRMGTKHK